MSGHLCPQCQQSFVLFDDVCDLCRKKAERRARNAANERRRRERNPEHVRALQRQWRSANPEKARAASKRTREKNADAIRERKRKWYDSNREKVGAYQKQHRAENRDKIREQKRSYIQSVGYRFRDFGVTQPEIAERLASQGGRCGICGTAEPGGKHGEWAFDHDHRFHKRDPRGHRGLLCQRCNLALGQFNDSPKTLLRAVRYLLRWRRSLRDSGAESAAA